MQTVCVLRRYGFSFFSHSLLCLTRKQHHIHDQGAENSRALKNRAQAKLDWSDGLVVGGYSFLVHHLKDEIKTFSSCHVEMGCVVKRVKETKDKTIVETADGRAFDADFVVRDTTVGCVAGET